MDGHSSYAMLPSLNQLRKDHQPPNHQHLHLQTLLHQVALLLLLPVLGQVTL